MSCLFALLETFTLIVLIGLSPITNILDYLPFGYELLRTMLFQRGRRNNNWLLNEVGACRDGKGLQSFGRVRLIPKEAAFSWLYLHCGGSNSSDSKPQCLRGYRRDPTCSLAI